MPYETSDIFRREASYCARRIYREEHRAVRREDEIGRLKIAGFGICIGACDI